MIQEKLEKSLAFKDEGNNLYKAKGQLISKGLFDVIVSTKNPTKIF
jgi:hypothetical protein